MGVLVEGKWQDQLPATKDSGGKFVRVDAGFRNWITENGDAGPSGVGGFKAEADRYHLYISHACPWANRTAIFRKLMGLEDIISLSVVDHFMGNEGWTFEEAGGDETRDHLFGSSHLHQIYTKAKSDYTGRVSVPVLWDKKQQTIVSNESSEIIRMFNSAFNEITGNQLDYYPVANRDEIDAVNQRVYDTLNNGVYECGFATTQAAYEVAFAPLFETLDWLEDILSGQAYLAGDQISEADWRLFSTLVRFDPVYVSHFKCNKKRIADYPNLSNYTRQLYQWPGVAETIDLHHIKSHYFGSHESINPTRIVPVGPQVDYSAPHDRDRF
ncbi:MAG: glutathione S-transferase family protein [Rhizobiaceae bacterium]|nr:glutathione S-transferase family protein [Rhizobiaceae bacterium]